MKKVLFLFGILVSMIVFAASASASSLDIYCGSSDCCRQFSFENDCYCEEGEDDCEDGSLCSDGLYIHLTQNMYCGSSGGIRFSSDLGENNVYEIGEAMKAAFNEVFCKLYFTQPSNKGARVI